MSTDDGLPRFDHANLMQASFDYGETWHPLQGRADEQEIIRAALSHPQHATLLTEEAGLALTDGLRVRGRIGPGHLCT